MITNLEKTFYCEDAVNNLYGLALSPRMAAGCARHQLRSPSQVAENILDGAKRTAKSLPAVVMADPSLNESDFADLLHALLLGHSERESYRDFENIPHPILAMALDQISREDLCDLLIDEAAKHLPNSSVPENNWQPYRDNLIAWLGQIRREIRIHLQHEISWGQA